MKETKKSRLKLVKASNHLTGVETPVFGVSWNPPTLDVEVAERLITFLEDRRALYNPFACETSHYVVMSILDIRRKLTDLLEEIDRDSPLAKSIASLRSACRSFQDRAESIGSDVSLYRPRPIWDPDDRDFFMALGELRTIFGIHIAQIAVKYGIDVEEQLAAIVPQVSDELLPSSTRGKMRCSPYPKTYLYGSRTPKLVLGSPSPVKRTSTCFQRVTGSSPVWLQQGYV